MKIYPPGTTHGISHNKMKQLSEAWLLCCGESRESVLGALCCEPLGGVESEWWERNPGHRWLSLCSDLQGEGVVGSSRNRWASLDLWFVGAILVITSLLRLAQHLPFSVSRRRGLALQ